MPSERKIEANRRNAEHSTSPNTPEGKAASTVNALKLGLHARDCVLPDEDRRGFDELLAALRDEHRPATPEEDFLVRPIAAAHWRLHRLIRMETGLFARQAPDDPSAPPLPGNEYDDQTKLLGAVFSRPAVPACPRPEPSDNMPPLNDLRQSAKTNPPFLSNASPSAPFRREAASPAVSGGPPRKPL